MIKIAEEAKCSVVVHTTNPPGKAKDIAELLRPGDVYAHVYQGKGESVVENGKVIQDFIEYQNKGIIFDAANGTNHFSLRVAECCMNQGFLPDIISTDLTIKSLYIPGKVFSLPFIQSKIFGTGNVSGRYHSADNTNACPYYGRREKFRKPLRRYVRRYCNSQNHSQRNDIRRLFW